jgi:two-component system, OmpR family, sensor histidine kinase KdpD
MEEHRPDPDALLAGIQQAESRQKRGHLKIFFGMAAGVGKTYTMLQAAHQLKNEGKEVVVGYVETHKRAETEALVAGLELVPRQKVAYRGTFLEEMDTDAILKRKPHTVLVDELAHTNAPGVRHLKRYQDVQEILEAGINVYTTVNVQHFESRADAVRQITGITIHETIPDSILDLADNIELIDLSPEDLRKRLSEGKVYSQDRIQTASNNFFRIGNLTALREMALRLTAERVDHQLQDYMQLKQIAGPWKSGERLMVAVGSSPFSGQLVRWTRRMAYNLEAPWLATYVETSFELSSTQKKQLADNIALVRSLGGEVMVTADNDVSNGLLRIARQRNVTQLVVGKPLGSVFREFLKGGTLVDHLIRKSGDIDIYVVTGDEPENKSNPMLPIATNHSSLTQYLIALAIVITTIFIKFIALPFMSYQGVGLLGLLSVLVIAGYIGRGPALLAATVSAILWNFLFIEPRFTFQISRSEDVILFLLYFAVAIFTGNLTARLRIQERHSRKNADLTMSLYTLTQEIAKAVNMSDVLKTAVTQIGRVFDAQVAFLLLDQTTQKPLLHPTSTLTLDEKELSVGMWSFENGKPAGRFTDTLPLATVSFAPLNTANRTVGVIGIRTKNEDSLTFDQEALLETFINQIALVIERELLDEAAEQSAMLKESERLYTTLLNSISHELRTPLATIKGASSGLMQPNTTEETRADLIENVVIASERLNRLVENLLDMSRLESGRLQLKRDWCDISEIVGVAVKNLHHELKDRQVIIEISPQLPLIQVDFVLIEQVIVNILDNACHYTPDNTAVLIQAYQKEKDWVEIVIRDFGAGIPQADIERIFEKFYRLPGTASGGTGLGLSISRGIIEAHNGTLKVSNAVGNGAEFMIRLPASTPPPVKEARM